MDDRQPNTDRSGEHNGENDGQEKGRGGRRNRQRGGRIKDNRTKYQGKCDKIAKHVYNTGHLGATQDLFVNTTREIAEYVAREYTSVGEFRLGMTNLELPTLQSPTPPEDQAGLAAIELYKLDLKDYHQRLRNREANQQKVFSLTLGQCSRSIRDRLEADQEWEQINMDSDVIELLKLIRQCLYNRATTRHHTHTLIDAECQLHRFKQGEKMTNSKYLEKLKALVDVVEHLGPTVGADDSRVAAYLEDPNNADEQEIQQAKASAREEYIACMLIIKSDPKRYGALVADLENGHTRGISGYPTTISKAYDMLVNYKQFRGATRREDRERDETGLSFYSGQDNSDNGARRSSGRGSGRGGGRRAGRGGRGQAGRGGNQNVDSNPNSDVVDGYSTMTLGEDETECFVQAGQGRSKIPPSWLLADSGSTVNIISNPTWLHNIRKSPRKLLVHGSTGSAYLEHIGDFGDYPEPVWYDPDGVANLMLLDNISKHFRVTWDSGKENSINVHTAGNNVMKFEASGNGLFVLDTKDNVKCPTWSFVTTVAGNSEGYTKREVAEALEARRLQNILIFPGMAEMANAHIRHLRNCPITRASVIAEDVIFGKNLGCVKGKTVSRPAPRTATTVDPIQPSIKENCSGLSLAINIFFVNKIPFLLTLSQRIRFITVDVLPNRQIDVVGKKIQQVLSLYAHRGLSVGAVHADPEFEPLKATIPILETAGADDHVPDIKRLVRTIKDRVRSAHSTLPYTHVPRIMVIHLVRNAVFWLNAFPNKEGVSSQHSPRWIITGREVEYDRHAHLEFGEYVQTHEKHSNGMEARTASAINLGPTGNQQGLHWFLSLATGERVACTRWTRMPAPQDAIDKVNEIGRRQKMPRNLSFTDRYGSEIADSLRDADHEDAKSETSDEDYSYASDEDDEDFESDADDDSNDHDDGDDPDEGSHDTGGYVNGSSNGIDDDAQSQKSQKITGVETRANPPKNTGVESDDADVLSEGNSKVDANESTPDTFPSNEQSESELDAEEEVESVMESDDGEDDWITEAELYRQAEQLGVDAAAGDPLPKRTTRRKVDDVYEYQFSALSDLDPDVAFALMMEEDAEEMFSFLTAQMSAKAGLKHFGEAGAVAIMKELEQLLYRKVMKGRKAGSLTKEEKKAALKYLMFLKEKRCGRIKGRGCADGWKQRLYKSKEETSLPTVSIELLIMTCIIDAREGREVITCDIPGAFMQVDMDERVFLKLEGDIANLLVRLDKSYQQFLMVENGKPVIYTELSKALYGTLQAALLFWQDLSGHLASLGFVANPYDSCVMNKMINGKQCTVAWHVDDLKISHKETKVAEWLVQELEQKYGKEAPLTVTRGKVHEYLGMTIDYSTAGKVKFSMFDFEDGIFEDLPANLVAKRESTPAASHLFETNESSPKIDDERKEQYHHTTAKLLYLLKRTRPDLQTTVSFLTTRVKAPDEDDWKKLGRCLRYLQDTRGLPLILGAGERGVIKWWIDASFAVHKDYKSHTGACMSMGSGCAINMSTKQKINTRSSTKAELVGVNDALAMVIWVRNFLIEQGFEVTDNVIFQDNKSAILLEENGRKSSGKHTRHIEIRYYFITDNIRRGTTRVEYCPTEEMVADFFTKPLQGSLFLKLRRIIMGEESSLPVPIDKATNAVASEAVTRVTDPGAQECVGNSEKGDDACSQDQSHMVMTRSWRNVVKR